MIRFAHAAIPVIATFLVATPIAWAFPDGLPVWRSIGIVLGWAAMGCLVASLLLMVREPRLAGALGGLERMYRWHHGLGFTAYIVLLLHPLAFAADAWNEAPRLAWQTLSPSHQSWPIWIGWISLLCMMTGMAASFSVGLSYPRWRLLHGMLGVGVVLGLVHLILLGLNALVFTVVVAALILLTWRTVRIDLGLSALPYVVAKVDRVAATTIEVGLRPLGRQVAVSPGQFIMVAFMNGPNYRGCGEYHPFTVSRIATQGELEVGIKALGDDTTHMQAMEPGVAARIQGPFGTFLAARPETPALWIAGGIGVTPFVAALRASVPSRPTTLIYLFRNEGDAAYLDELRSIAATATLLTLIEHATGDLVADMNKVLPASIEASVHHCYLCGPPGLIAAALPALHRLGFAPDHIHYERFDFR